MQVQVDLLLLRTCRPVRRHMVRSGLHPHHPVTVNDDAVPAVVRTHLTAQQAGPEAALGGDVVGVEDDGASADLYGDLPWLKRYRILLQQRSQGVVQRPAVEPSAVRICRDPRSGRRAVSGTSTDTGPASKPP